MHQKTRLFELKNRNIFWKGGTAPFPDPSFGGEGTPPTYTPSLRRLRYLDHRAYGARLVDSARMAPRPQAPLFAPLATPFGYAFGLLYCKIAIKTLCAIFSVLLLSYILFIVILQVTKYFDVKGGRRHWPSYSVRRYGYVVKSAKDKAM